MRVFLEILGAAGIDKVSDLTAGHIYRRIGTTKVAHYDEIFTFLKPKTLLGKTIPDRYKENWKNVSSDHF